jgi:proline racemase
MMDWSDRLETWTPPDTWGRVVTVDLHTEGEPLRVIISGFPDLRGETILEMRRDASANHDAMRRALMWEPRGHADMYGCLLVPPVTKEADFGVLFMHNDGFSTMCGHGIIGVTTALLECGLIEGNAPDGVALERVIGIDTPAGFIRARAEMAGGRVGRVSFTNVPSFTARLDAQVHVEGLGAVRYDLAYGGAFYAYVSARDFGLRLAPEEAGRLSDIGRRIKDAIQHTAPPEHPDAADLEFVYGTIFVGTAHDAMNHSRNVCVFADGEIDRSPTGTGVSGRLALHDTRGEIEVGEEVTIESILGTSFQGRIQERTRVGKSPAVIAEVAGSARITGRHEFFTDPADPLADGFLLR